MRMNRYATCKNHLFSRQTETSVILF